MESIVENVEDQRQTEGTPANSQGHKELVGFDIMRHSGGVYQRYGASVIRSQQHDDIDSEAKYL